LEQVEGTSIRDNQKLVMKARLTPHIPNPRSAKDPNKLTRRTAIITDRNNTTANSSALEKEAKKEHRHILAQRTSVVLGNFAKHIDQIIRCAPAGKDYDMTSIHVRTATLRASEGEL
jgi:hypothetical protein